MHFGGAHFFIGLLYLIVCFGITFIHINLFYMLFVFFSRTLYKFRHSIAQNQWIAGKGKSPDELLKRPTRPYLNKNFCSKAIRLLLIFMCLIYIHQRISWMGSDNKHYKAKEYWVAGQVVYTHGMILRKVFHPSNLIIQPYTLLQKAIYDTGEKYIPAKDGERYVWQNIWLLYPYSRKFEKPYMVTSKEYSPKMVKLLDRYWETIEGIATMEIADTQMEIKSRLVFPLLTSYYVQFQVHYNGPSWGAGMRTRNNKKCIARNYKMLKWLDALHATWKENGEWETVKKKYPFAACFRQEVVNRLVRNLALSLPLSDNFSCNHPLMQRMYKEYQDAMSTDTDKNSFLNLMKTNKKQATLAHQAAIYSPVGSAGYYLMKQICGKEMPEQLNIFINRYRLYSPFTKKDENFRFSRVTRVFRKELKPILKERKK